MCVLRMELFKANDLTSIINSFRCETNRRTNIEASLEQTRKPPPSERLDGKIASKAMATLRFCKRASTFSSLESCVSKGWYSHIGITFHKNISRAPWTSCFLAVFDN